MSSTLSDWFKLASGHNNTAELSALHLMSPPLFADYSPKGGVLTEWHEGQQEERDGDGVLQYVGKPWIAFRLYAVSTAEWAVLYAYAGLVTAHLYNKTTVTWGNYNGRLEFPDKDRKWGLDQWDEVVGYIYALTGI